MPRVRPLTAAMRQDDAIRRAIRMAMAADHATQEHMADLCAISRVTLSRYIKQPSVMPWGVMRVIRDYVKKQGVEWPC